MTLHRHQSHLIPEVEYGLDGGIFVTDREGTFPLSATKNKIREPKPDYDDGTYRSYDPRRKKKFNKNRPSNRYQHELETATLGSYKGSLPRKPKLHRSRSYRMKDEKRFSTLESDGSASLQRPRRGSTPKMPKGYHTGSLKRTNYSLSSADARAARKELRDFHTKTLSKTSNGKLPLIIEEKPFKDKKLWEEAAPSWLFIVGGLLLLAAGVIRTLLCPWHEYFSPLWTGALVIILGLLGVRHKKDYLTGNRNWPYIILGIVCTLAVCVTSTLNLMSLIPMIKAMVNQTAHQDPFRILQPVQFPAWKSPIQVNNTAVPYVCISSQFAALLFTLVDFSVLTATMLVASNYWDASHNTTGECDHRGNPRLFNPLEQCSLGEATVFLGALAVLLSQANRQHYWTPVWSGGLVMLAAGVSFCHAKRPDIEQLGLLAMFLEFVAFVGCSAATVFIALNLELGYRAIKQGETDPFKLGFRCAEMVAYCLFILAVMTNICFVVGILFRQFRQVCCKRCSTAPGDSDI